MTITRIKPGARMSQCVVHGDTVYTAGQIADDSSEDVAGQTRQVLAKIDGLLAEAGSDKSKILKATIWLTDISRFNEMNSVWDAWVDQDNPPVRACVESTLAMPALSVEIMVEAAK
ncbi:MAG: 2-iminobutanoate/2-iminopropanoate deaminase [Alphaproteobacteria bacterium MarineAlpha10_Bin1]|jgi:enamine deaminase RidA (YjgF/YER057c/UK114 family)|nr:MAG: 2-iminobutanoate/2-iminopropanoate deaminase [Alphaproteobacteria bacterium MarineAlpha10_Bin1]